jgi:thymidine phosphorylase
MTATVQPAHGVDLVRVRPMGIDTYQDHVIYMRSDCPVCRSEGWTSQVRVQATYGDTTILATLNVVDPELLPAPDDAGLSQAAWHALGVPEGATVRLAPSPVLDSLQHVRAKIYGQRLDRQSLEAIVTDVAAGRYSPIHLAAFVTACAGDHLDLPETVALTEAMIGAGDRLRWPGAAILDKHCVGGLPGNRTTMLVVPIVAAFGLTIPKTSSRAITSPAGTADAMETVAPVDLSLSAMRRVVEREGGCIVWGGAVRLSPADDILIRVERPLDLDSEGQLVASVLSKKAAAGSTHVLIDMPVGPTAKVRTLEAARNLTGRLSEVGRAVGLTVRVVETDGTQPVGRGIGPALEARDVLAVLQGLPNATRDLRSRALRLAGDLLEIAEAVAPGSGFATAADVLDSGQAWRKFQAICEAQGGLRQPPRAAHSATFEAPHRGHVVAIDNRRLARIAKLAGAPAAPAAGLEYLAPLGTMVEARQPLFVLHAASSGELTYARSYAEAGPFPITLSDPDATADPSAAG